MYKYILTATIVIYKNNPVVLKKAIDSFLNTKLSIKLILIDNSPTTTLKNISKDNRVFYLSNPSNPGFGAGHNIGINLIINDSKFHLILNPDVYFRAGVIEELINYLENNKNIGVIMPKILYPDGQIQYLAKLLPTPFDFLVRRFSVFSYLKNKFAYRFELKRSGYNKIIDAPFLSGCFLIFPTKVLNTIKGFDENIFMYTEDIDICRRIIKSGYKSIFYPKVFIYHAHEKKYFNKWGTFKIYFKSAIYYFNKWGWFIDLDRIIINNNTIKQFK